MARPIFDKTKLFKKIKLEKFYKKRKTVCKPIVHTPLEIIVEEPERTKTILDLSELHKDLDSIFEEYKDIFGEEKQ